MTFRGTFDLTLDAKNRLTVPTRYRAAYAEGVVLAAGLEDCVAIWRPEDYDAWTTAALQATARSRPSTASSTATSPPTRTRPSSTGRAA